MGHCVGWMELQRLCTLVFISILYLTNDNYYCYNEHYMLPMYQLIIMFTPIYIIFLLLVQSKTLAVPIEENVATIGLVCIFFNTLKKKFINDFLVINSLLLKITLC